MPPSRHPSEKAWIRRNDPRKVINIEYNMGSYVLFDTFFKNLSAYCPASTYGHPMAHTGKPIVHQSFHALCQQLYQKEKAYFKAHDPRHQKLANVEERGKQCGIVFDHPLLNDFIWNGKEEASEEALD